MIPTYSCPAIFSLLIQDVEMAFFKYVANYIADSKKVIMVMINLNHNHVLSIASQFVQFHTFYQHTIQDMLQRQVPQVQNPLHRHDLPQLNAFEESATAVL